MTDELLEAGADLVVVGRAGVGLDNVDVDAATKRGVMVVNADVERRLRSRTDHGAHPCSGPQHASGCGRMQDGRWERSKWTGIELNGRTLGIIGLGRIGKLVAQRAHAFGMKLIAFDPYIAADRATALSVELVGLDELARRSDIVTVHVAKTPETIDLIDAEFLAKAKDGIRIINVARGGIVNERDLYDAIVAGKVGGAGLDVFNSEPCTDSPLFGLAQVVATPHLGASTTEAQDKAGVTIAGQIALALAGDFVPFAVNIDAAEVAETLKPYLPLAEQLGAIFASIVGPLPADIEVVFEGDIGGYDNRLVTLAAIKGMLTTALDEPVSYVNALSLLEANNIDVTAVQSSTPNDFVNRLAIRGDGRRIAVTVMGRNDEARLVRLDDSTIDIPPADNMLVIRNDDHPGMIGIVGTILGNAGINVDDMDVGRTRKDGGAIMVIAAREPVPESVVAEIAAVDGIVSVANVVL
ncbi:MAG: phosphoglycerate dehydrogenase [Acidimicrobiales bacterium]